MYEDEQQFPDQNVAFAAKQANLERRRALARQLIEQGMSRNIGQGYRGGKVFIVGNPLGSIASSIGGAILDSRHAKEAEQLQGQEQAAATELIRRLGTPGSKEQFGPPEEGQAGMPQQSLNQQEESARRLGIIGEGMALPSLRQTLAAQLGQEMDYPRQREIELAKSKIEADKLAAAEARQKALFAQQEIMLGQKFDRMEALRAVPSIQIHTGGGGGKGGGNEFGGAAPVIGIDPRTDQPVYRHTKSGQLFRYDENGNAVPHEGAIGPKPTAVGQPTESERSSAGYLGRMQEAEKNIGTIKGGEQTELTTAVGKLPGVGEYARRKVETVNQQKYRQSADDWIRAKLRKESGAVIGKDEMEAEYRTYFPQPGDTPQVILQKAQSRAQAEQQMLSSAGRAKPVAAPPVQPQAPAVAPGTKGMHKGRPVVMGTDGEWHYEN